MATKKTAAKKTPKAAETNENLEQVTSIQAPPVEDPGRAPTTPPEAKTKGRTARPDPNSEPQGEDRVYGIESRDRWADSDSATLSEMHKDSRAIDAGDANGGDEA